MRKDVTEIFRNAPSIKYTNYGVMCEQCTSALARVIDKGDKGIFKECPICGWEIQIYR